MGNVVNIVSRTVPRLHKASAGKPGAFDDSPAAVALIPDARTASATVEGLLRALDFQGAARAVVEIDDDHRGSNR